LYILHRPDIDEYRTIHHEDAELFHEIVNNNLFDKEDKNTGAITRYENKLELITDKVQIKKVLDEKYSSRSRTEEYTAGLPSASVINALFPWDIDYRKTGSKFNFLRWWNNTSLEDMNAQKVKNKLSTDSGTFIHLVLQLACEDDSRIYLKKRSLKTYIEQACQSQEIIDMINNFEDRKEYFVDMASNTLKKFFEFELEKIFPVANELFFNTGKIQGTIDLINYYQDRLCLSDFKTSKGSVSRNQIVDKHYLNQLLIYADALYEIGFINKKEREELDYYIYFWNWASYNSATYQYSKEEVEKWRAYNNFIINWYTEIKNGN